MGCERVIYVVKNAIMIVFLCLLVGCARCKEDSIGIKYANGVNHANVEGLRISHGTKLFTLSLNSPMDSDKAVLLLAIGSDHVEIRDLILSKTNRLSIGQACRIEGMNDDGLKLLSIDALNSTAKFECGFIDIRPARTPKADPE